VSTTSPGNPKWQTLTEEGAERTEMLRVSGGWLYRTTRWSRNSEPISVALAFQPDMGER
jgi:hypothetical protein